MSSRGTVISSDTVIMQNFIITILISATIFLLYGSFNESKCPKILNTIYHIFCLNFVFYVFVTLNTYIGGMANSVVPNSGLHCLYMPICQKVRCSKF